MLILCWILTQNCHMDHPSAVTISDFFFFFLNQTRYQLKNFIRATQPVSDRTDAEWCFHSAILILSIDSTPANPWVTIAQRDVFILGFGYIRCCSVMLSRMRHRFKSWFDSLPGPDTIRSWNSQDWQDVLNYANDPQKPSILEAAPQQGWHCS